jgi:hypothetical protein
LTAAGLSSHNVPHHRPILKRFAIEITFHKRHQIRFSKSLNSFNEYTNDIIPTNTLSKLPNTNNCKHPRHFIPTCRAPTADSVTDHRRIQKHQIGLTLVVDAAVGKVQPTGAAGEEGGATKSDEVRGDVRLKEKQERKW